MFLVLLLQDESAVQCYELQSTLAGYRQNKIFKLTVTPIDNEQCSAFDGMASTMYLQYLDTSNTMQNISAAYTHKKNGKIVITFTTTSSTYKLIEAQQRLSFQPKITSSLTPQRQAITTVEHVQMDATDCWNDIEFVTDYITGKEMISVIGTPLDCSVQSPVAYIQFMDESQWKSIRVYGEIEATDAANSVFIDQQTFTSTYDFSTITTYRQTLSQLNALILTDTQAEDEAALKVHQEYKTNFQRLQTLLSANKYLETRLYLQNILTTGQSQDIIGESTGNVRSQFKGCFNHYDNLDVKIFLSSDQIGMNFNQSGYLSDTGCSSGALYSIQVQYQITYSNGTIEKKTTEWTTASHGQLVYMPGLEYPLEKSINISSIESASSYIYLIVYDANNNTLTFEAHQYTPLLQCEYFKEYNQDKNEACITVYFDSNKQCQYEGNRTHSMSVLDMSTLTQMFSYEYTIPYKSNSQVIKVCSSKASSVSQGHAVDGVTGSYKQFLKFYKNKKAYLKAVLQSSNDRIYTTVVKLDSTKENFTISMIVNLVLFILTIILTVALVKIETK